MWTQRLHKYQIRPSHKYKQNTNIKWNTIIRILAGPDTGSQSTNQLLTEKHQTRPSSKHQREMSDASISETNKVITKQESNLIMWTPAVLQFLNMLTLELQRRLQDKQKYKQISIKNIIRCQSQLVKQTIEPWKESSQIITNKFGVIGLQKPERGNYFSKQHWLTLCIVSVLHQKSGGTRDTKL